MFRFFARFIFGLVGFALWFPAALFDTCWDRLTGRDLAPEIRAEEHQADAEVIQHDLEYDRLQEQIAAEEARRALAVQARHEAERQRLAHERYRQSQRADRHDRFAEHDVDLNDEEALSFAP